MKLFDDAQQQLAHAISGLGYGNPFVPERLAYERQILGEAFIPMGAAWHKHVDDPVASPNLSILTEKSQAFADGARARLMAGCEADDMQLALYETVVLYLVYSRYRASFTGLIRDWEESARTVDQRVGFYAEFLNDLQYYLAVPGRELTALSESAHVFAGLFQVRRAFHHTFEYIIGGSLSTAKLRAAVWQSVFSHNMIRYRRDLFRHMGDMVTLITGPSGTGKELVARAIGLSRYIPFDPKTQTFSKDGAGTVHPVNLSALSPTLVESELFGHCRGAFTGAVEDRTGWLEVCKPLGTVFLDEIGEIDATLQVKLLRALETRTFQRVGESEPRRFQGKIIAATNRDLHADVQAGRVRADFYYRICSDVIVTPSLRERLQDSPEELRDLLRFISRTIADGDEAKKVAAEVEAWIVENLGMDYGWPGNVRELEQCMRNVVIHGAYRAPRAPRQDAREELVAAFRTGRLAADELLRHYCTMVYADTGTYQEAGRRLVLDRRTVKDKIDPALLRLYAPDDD
jgi:sigma-54 interacting transcriptional regulator